MHIYPFRCRSGVQASRTSQVCGDAQARTLCCAPGQSPRQILQEQVQQHHRSGRDGCVSNTVEERAALEAQVHIEGKMKSVEIAEGIVKEPRNFTYMNRFSRLTLTYMAHAVNVCV